MDQGALYPAVDLQLTLRCNLKCADCIKFSSMKRQTGLDYSESDLTWSQLQRFIVNVESIRERTQRKVIGVLTVTGGEPLLHPEVDKFVEELDRHLLKLGIVERLQVNTNGVKAPSDYLRPFCVTFLEADKKNTHHDPVLLHPGKRASTFRSCKHYRKGTVVANYQGYSQCCAADGYIRLFALEHLIHAELPDNGLPVDRMDDVCKHCPFGVPGKVHSGVATVYQEQAELNRKGRRVLKVL